MIAGAVIIKFAHYRLKPSVATSSRRVKAKEGDSCAGAGSGAGAYLLVLSVCLLACVPYWRRVEKSDVSLRLTYHAYCAAIS